MPSSSSSNTSQSHKARIFSVDLEGNVYCHYYRLAVRRVARHRSSRAGHEFYGCPLWPDCKIFIWKEQVDETLSCGVNISQTNRHIIQKNEALEMKLSNLEMEKSMLEEENKKLKHKLKVSKCPASPYVIVLVLLFVCFKCIFGH
ncbi:hypothetical protein Hanom_Chr08g00712491 [Helianthus anomalus]